MFEICSHHVCGEDFSLCDDGSLFEAGEGVFRERAQILESLFEEFCYLCFDVIVGVELFDVLEIFSLELVDDVVCSVGVFLVEIVGYLHERVCCAGHCRENDKGGFSGFCHELAYAFHSLWRTYRGSAEFHYFHILSCCVFVVSVFLLSEFHLFHCSVFASVNDSGHFVEHGDVVC